MTPKFGENWLMKCIVVFSFWGGLRPPDPLTRGSAPGPRWGHSPHTPIIGSRYRARHSPPPQTLKPNSAYEAPTFLEQIDLVTKATKRKH